MPAGGYQKPGKPAPVSGPGRLAKRTDSQPTRELPNAQYGEAAEYRTLQQSAPMAQTPSASGSAPGPAASAGRSVPIGLGEPTARPDEPITEGADVGPGAGMSSLGLPDRNADVRMRLQAIYTQYPTEDLRELLEAMD